ncbi:MAG TPA: hypothetical protein VG820_10570 [Fimbriimonadaceae bacterium]|nr:hypothetical protein [Fimbriimonadaceae bacterium]
MRRKKLTAWICAAIFAIAAIVGGLAYLGRGPYAFLEDYHPVPLEAPPFALPRYEYMEKRPRLLIFSPQEAPKVLRDLRRILGHDRGYRVVDEIKKMGSDDAEDDDFHPVIWSFSKDGEVVEYMGADLALFGFGFQGVPAPKELQRGGCVVMIDHTPRGIEAAWLKLSAWLGLKPKEPPEFNPQER